jgi:hypothetical protein
VKAINELITILLPILLPATSYQLPATSYQFEVILDRNGDQSEYRNQRERKRETAGFQCRQSEWVSLVACKYKFLPESSRICWWEFESVHVE